MVLLVCLYYATPPFCNFNPFVLGKLLKNTVNWLQNSEKPLDLRKLETIEQKVTQHFGGLSFDSLGAGPFLSFIQKKETRPHLGKSIVVSTEEENELHELLIIKKDIKLFVEQCGAENLHPKVNFCKLLSLFVRGYLCHGFHYLPQN